METVTFPSAGATLTRTFYAPQGSPRAVLAVVHGYADHAGRHERLAGELVAKGYAVLTYDYRGHGRASGPRGHCDRFEEFVDDLRAACGVAQKLVPGRPLGLVAFSHGGLVTMRALCEPERAPDVVAAALISPFLGVSMAVPAWKTVVGRVASRYLPRLSMPNGIKPEDLSHDAAVGEAYRKDPFVHRVATARWFTEMVAAQDYVRAHAARVRVPTLWLLAGDDRVVSAPAAEAVASAVGGDKTVKLYNGLFHELLNAPEPDRARVAADLFSWLDARFPPV